VDDTERFAHVVDGGMDGREREGDFACDVRCHVDGHAADVGFEPAKRAVKIESVDELHREIGLAAHHAGAVHRHDVGMLHAAMQLRLAFEQLEMRTLAHGWEQSFDDESRRRGDTDLRMGEKHFRGSPHGNAPLQNERAKHRRTLQARVSQFDRHAWIMGPWRIHRTHKRPKSAGE
jgi:hypothetical protein